MSVLFAYEPQATHAIQTHLFISFVMLSELIFNFRPTQYPVVPAFPPFLIFCHHNIFEVSDQALTSKLFAGEEVQIQTLPQFAAKNVLFIVGAPAI